MDGAERLSAERARTAAASTSAPARISTAASSASVTTLSTRWLLRWANVSRAADGGRFGSDCDPALVGGPDFWRFGGDEFVVLCEDLVRIEAAEPLARRLAEAVAQPVSTGDRLLVVHASIGVVVEQNPATSAESLVKRADEEMYRVKHGSR